MAKRKGKFVEIPKTKFDEIVGMLTSTQGVANTLRVYTDALRMLGEGVALEEIPSGGLALLRSIHSTEAGMRRAAAQWLREPEIIELRAEKKLGELETRHGFKLEEMEMGRLGKERMEEVKTEQQVARRRGLMEVEREFKAADVAAAEATTSAKAKSLFTSISNQINAPKKGLPSKELFEAQISELKKLDPIGATRLEDMYRIKQADAATTAEQKFVELMEKKRLPVRQEAIDLVKNEASRTGIVPSMSPKNPTVGRALNLARSYGEFEATLRGGGLRPLIGLTEAGTTGVTGLERIGALPGFKTAGTRQALPLVQQAFESATLGSKGSQARTMGLIDEALGAMRGGVRGRLGMGLGALALFLLPMLLGKGKKEQEIPPLLQLQMMQQLAQLQQNQALAQSLMGSRAAASERNLAQADLLRLQALQQQPALMLS